MGMLPGLDGDYLAQSVTLTHNDCGRFQDRWTYLKVDPASPSVFTRGIEKGIYLPMRHGEGKFLCDSDATLGRIEREHLAAFKYSGPDFAAPTMEFPANPNGSHNAIAGICDPTGRLMGLMPHPEAFVHYTQHPRWTREQLPEEGDGLILYRNAAEYVRQNLI
jgi:phosphoribosylformylglycinamidine synthase